MAGLIIFLLIVLWIIVSAVRSRNKVLNEQKEPEDAKERMTDADRKKQSEDEQDRGFQAYRNYQRRNGRPTSPERANWTESGRKQKASRPQKSAQAKENSRTARSYGRNAGSSRNAGRTSAKTESSGANTILERAKRNLQEVHESHQNTEGSDSRSLEEAVLRRSTEFGQGPLTEAASGAKNIPDDRERAKRLAAELIREKTDYNSLTGQNRIMEEAKENSLETQLENLREAQTDLMKEVQDLMIIGPNTELPFERDFVAEGTEMLNQMYI